MQNFETIELIIERTHYKRSEEQGIPPPPASVKGYCRPHLLPGAPSFGVGKQEEIQRRWKRVKRKRKMENGKSKGKGYTTITVKPLGFGVELLLRSFGTHKHAHEHAYCEEALPLPLSQPFISAIFWLPTVARDNPSSPPIFANL